MKTITLALTNFNRFDLLITSFKQVLCDDRIAEIVISDDASSMLIYEKIVEHFKDVEKVKVHRNATNQGVYRNKYHSVLHATSEWVIVFDSDNIMGVDYIDALYATHEKRGWDSHVVYCPEFARPKFDYTRFAGHTITKANASMYFHWNQFDCLINTMNCFVHREEFLKVFDSQTEPIAADSAYFNYRWLMAGNRMYVVPGLQYDHLVHKGSHYVNNATKSNRFHSDLMYKFKTMQ